MESNEMSRLSLIVVVSVLLLGTGLFIPVTGAVNTTLAGLASGAGGVQVINADGYGPYPGSNVSFPAYICAALPCTKDLQAKLDIPTATFPAYVQVFYVKIGSGWQSQVFSAGAPRSIMSFPHNLDLGAVTFGQYGLYVLAFANASVKSTSWQYFQVQQTSPNPTPAGTSVTTLNITGTFKVVSSRIIATSTMNGINTTDSISMVARNDSTSPGVITGRITVETVRHVNMTTGNGTSFGIGTFSGTIAGKGPGQCVYRNNATLTAQGTPKASSNSKHWITECTGGLQGITEITTTIGSGTFAAVVTLDPPVDPPAPAPAAQSIGQYSYVIIAAVVFLLLVSAVLFARARKASRVQHEPQTILVKN